MDGITFSCYREGGSAFCFTSCIGMVRIYYVTQIDIKEINNLDT